MLALYCWLAEPEKVISGHLGWVRSICVEPGNDWFATGAADRTIKVVKTGELNTHSLRYGILQRDS